MRTRLMGIVGVVLALLLVAAACSSNKEESSAGGESGESEGGTITLDGQSANDHGSEDVAGKSDISLELDNFYFEPTVLNGEAGQTVTIELENEGDVEHNFSVSDQGIDQDVEAGESADVEVTFPDSGTLVFFCKYHQSQGMVGGLEVA